MVHEVTFTFEGDERLELEAGITVQGSGPHYLPMRHAKDPALLDAYRDGKITIESGGEWLRQQVGEYEYESYKWNKLTNMIEDGELDEDLELILAEDHRDSVIEAAETRLNSIRGD